MAWPGHDPGSPLRALAGDLGAVRDADVLAARLEATAGRLPEGAREAGLQVAAGLRDEVASARARLLTTLRDPAYPVLLGQLVEAANRPALAGRADRRARRVLPRLVRRPWRRLRRDGRKRPPVVNRVHSPGRPPRVHPG